MMRREKRRREYLASETNTGDNDKKEDEDTDTKLEMYGELLTKRPRFHAPESKERLPTDDQHVSLSSVCVSLYHIFVLEC